MTCTLCHAPHDDDAPCTPAPKPPRAGWEERDRRPGAPIWAARYRGQCPTCDTWFPIGTEITHHPDGGAGHVNCIDPW